MITDFSADRPIYLQILEFCLDRISSEEWTPGGRIPSVKELSVTMTVNPRTVMRTYEELSERGIIFQRRGLGFFVADDALLTVRKLRVQEFEQTVLPEFINRMLRAGYPVARVIERLSELKGQVSDCNF